MQVRTFPRGIRPNDHKDDTSAKPVEALPLPAEVTIPLRQHIGTLCEPLVSRGDRVRAGQKIADSPAPMAVPVHASVAGEVIAVEPRPHHSGVKLLSVVIKTGEQQDESSLDPLPGEPTAADIRARAREAGIVGLGGAGFPTVVKLTPPEGARIDTVLINGCECEPYLTADHRNMVEKTEALIDGTALIRRAVGADKAYIGIENNKPDAVRKLIDAVGDRPDIEVVALEAKYPQGGEKQLIEAILGRQVPSGKWPSAVGALVHNVGTTIAISEAVRGGRPLTRKVLTVGGPAIAEPKNVEAPIGTSVADIVAACGGFASEPSRVILGGPMMGVTLSSLDVPIVKATPGVVAFNHATTFIRPDPCIKCGNCLQVCPVGLNPTRLAALVEHGLWDELDTYRIRDCIECGSCSFICASRRPLIQWIRLGKSQLAKKRVTR